MNKKANTILYMLLAAYLSIVSMFVSVIILFPKWLNQNELRYSEAVQRQIHEVITENPIDQIEDKMLLLRDEYPFEISIYKNETKIFQTLPEISFSNLRNILQDDVVIIEQQGFVETKGEGTFKVWYSIYRLPTNQYLDWVFKLQLILIGLSFLVVLTISIILQNLLIKPLKKVKQSIDKLESYDFDAIEETDDVITEGVKRFATGLQGKIQDVSKKHTALEQALQLERERLTNMMTISRGAIHDLKSPIHQTMIENDYFLQEQENLSEEAKMVAEYNRNRMEKLILELNEVLSLLDTNPKALVEIKNKFDAVELFKEIKKSFSTYIDKRSMYFYADMPENLEVNLNKVCLHLLIHNMLSNAVKYGEEGTEIEFELYEDQGGFYLKCINQATEINIIRMKKSEDIFGAVSEELDEDHEYSSGNGLHLIKELATIANGIYEFEVTENKVTVSIVIPKE